MKITLVKPPQADPANQKAGGLLELAVRAVCAQQPGWECITLEGVTLPGPFSFFKGSRAKNTIRNTNPDLVLFASPENLLPIKGLPAMALITRYVTGSSEGLRKKLASLQAVITDLAMLKRDITDYAGIDAKLVYTLPLALANANKPATDPALTREKFTSGHEYFFYGGAINAGNEWERMLQAFSVFKKWQRSGLRLVLAGGIAAGYEEVFNEKFSSYKFREDVITIDNPDLAAQRDLIAAAFAVLAPGRSFNARMDMTYAIEAGIPVIADEAPVSRALCGDAALYADPASKESLSGHMILVYKNEAVYNQLAHAGKLASESFDRTQMLRQLHTALLAAAER